MSNTPVAKLDIEVTQSNKTSKNLILIGGDCVNRLIAEVENVSYGGCPSGQESKITSIKGDSWLALMNSPYAQGKAVLIVGGVNIADVRSAATILKDYKAYQAAGKLFGTNCAVRNLNGTLALSCT
jgi:S-layer protein (TIGR01564 family)